MAANGGKKPNDEELAAVLEQCMLGRGAGVAVEEFIELIGYLLCSQPRVPLLIAGTARWEEIPEGHPLPGLVDALQRDHAVTVVTVDPLDQASTTALAAKLLGRNEIEAGLARRLWSETEGNPLFVTEIIQAGLTSDDKTRVLTPTMRSVLRARLDQLSEDAQRLADVKKVRNAIEQFYLDTGEFPRANANSPFGGWDVARPIQRDLVEAIRGSKVHVIFTMRGKQEYVIEENARVLAAVDRFLGEMRVDQRPQLGILAGVRAVESEHDLGLHGSLPLSGGRNQSSQPLTTPSRRSVSKT